MQASQLVPFLLFLHVMGAILAFGPTYAYSIMASLGRKEPQHANFSARQIELIGNRLVYPLAIFQGVTGVLLIWAAGINVMSSAWLRHRHRPVPLRADLCAHRPAQRPPSAHRAELHPAAARRPARPAAPGARRDRQGDREGGMLLGITIAVIVFCMVVKPTF